MEVITLNDITSQIICTSLPMNISRFPHLSFIKTMPAVSYPSLPNAQIPSLSFLHPKEPTRRTNRKGKKNPGVRTRSDKMPANAKPLFPTSRHNEEQTTVVTSQTPSGLIYHSALMSLDAPDPKYPGARRTYSVLLHGPAGKTRREAMMGLLGATEKEVSRKVLKK